MNEDEHNYYYMWGVVEKGFKVYFDTPMTETQAQAAFLNEDYDDLLEEEIGVIVSIQGCQGYR